MHLPCLSAPGVQQCWLLFGPFVPILDSLPLQKSQENLEIKKHNKDDCYLLGYSTSSCNFQSKLCIKLISCTISDGFFMINSLFKRQVVESLKLVNLRVGMKKRTIHPDMYLTD